MTNTSLAKLLLYTLGPGMIMAGIAVATTVNCKARDARLWIGMDRSAVSCSYDGPRRDQMTCVGGGVVYRCVTEEGSTWRCAALVLGASRLGGPAENPDGAGPK